ncbi:MAG: hypothetical protein P4L50_21990 [Anaerolineaceae bacterium]|nr:hypothetical protein [Anaerolineaceae bacterium]
MNRLDLIQLIIVIILAVVADYFFVKWLAGRWVSSRRRQGPDQDTVSVLGKVSPLMTWLRHLDYGLALRRLKILFDVIHQAYLNFYCKLKAFGSADFSTFLASKIHPGSRTSGPPEPLIAQPRSPMQLPSATEWIEIGLILAWAVWVGRGYLNFSEQTLPAGRETAMVTQSHYVWSMFERCGLCMLWNGQVDGGNPAFVETHGAVLHPLVILTTLLWGVINGTKILLIACLAMAGFAQWSLARVMRLGTIPRMWSAAMAVIGGQLAGKMDYGGVMFVLSIASASLVFAPALEIALYGRRRSVVWMGLALALTWLAGQGYVQVVLGLSIPFALCVFIFRKRTPPNPVWKDYFWAFLLSFLLIGIFWVPLAHFWQNFAKDGDSNLSGFLHFPQIPLNLVISDRTYFQLNQYYLYIHYIFIGWIPVVLTILSFFLVRQKNRRLFAFLWIAILLIFLVCSQEFVRLAIIIFPYVQYLRNLPVGAGLAVPLILALAAWSLDRFLVEGWSSLLKIGRSLDRPGSRFTAELAVVGIAGLAIFQVYSANIGWLKVQQLDIPAVQMNALVTSQSEWISPPLANYSWFPYLLEHGLKLTNIFRPWHWVSQPAPNPFLEAVYNTNAAPGPGSINKIGIIDYIMHPGNPYAFIRTSLGDIPCRAVAQDGNIDASCSASSPGTLILNENMWSGWFAWRDGHPIPLLGGKLLSVDAPAGPHRYSFRYWPWDVPLGVLITLLGIRTAFWLGWKRQPAALRIPAE